jgi:hypothetical protein
MRQTTLLRSVPLVILLLLAAVQAKAQTQSVEQLSWMSGCWVSVGGERGNEEHWLAAAGGTMLGIGRTVKGGKTVEWEFMQLRDENGHVDFVATPSGQTTAKFRLIKLEGQRAVFENLGHDFPQRVIYERKGDELTGRIEGTSKGKERAFDYPMHRGNCQGS